MRISRSIIHVLCLGLLVACGGAGSQGQDDAGSPPTTLPDGSTMQSLPDASTPTGRDGGCVPTGCNGRVCGGDDGCGRSCGSCPPGRTCNNGQCVCQPNCNGRSCGPDGCGGTCGNNNGACPSGQSCSNGVCVCQPNCNGRNCGSDGCGGTCGNMNGGCTDGSECTGGVCIYTGFSTLSWTVTNGIPETLLYRFFDENRNLVWPNANQAYTLAPNASETKGLRCNIGDNICFGARNAAMTRYWGVDLDRSKPCANCCFICATRSVSLPRITY